MTKLHPSVIEAATYWIVEDCVYQDEPNEAREDRARRVIRAQAQPEAINDEAVNAALDAWYHGENWRGLFVTIDAATNLRRDMRAAISAALLHMAGAE